MVGKLIDDGQRTVGGRVFAAPIVPATIRTGTRTSDRMTLLNIWLVLSRLIRLVEWRRRQVRQNKSKASLLSRPLRVLVVEAGYDLDRQNAERQREVTRARPARFATSQPAVRYGMRAWARVATTELRLVLTRSDTISASATPTTPGTIPITNGCPRRRKYSLIAVISSRSTNPMLKCPPGSPIRKLTQMRCGLRPLDGIDGPGAGPEVSATWTKSRTLNAIRNRKKGRNRGGSARPSRIPPAQPSPPGQGRRWCRGHGDRLAPRATESSRNQSLRSVRLGGARPPPY